MLIQSLEATFDERFKIESCQVSILNSVDDLVKLEYKDWFWHFRIIYIVLWLFVTESVIGSHHKLVRNTCTLTMSKSVLENSRRATVLIQQFSNLYSDSRKTNHTQVSYKVGCVFPMLIAKWLPERCTPLNEFFYRTNNSWFAFQVKECFHTRKCWNNYWFWMRANIQSNFFAQIIDMDGNVIILQQHLESIKRQELQWNLS